MLCVVVVLDAVRLGLTDHAYCTLLPPTGSISNGPTPFSQLVATPEVKPGIVAVVSLIATAATALVSVPQSPVATTV